MTTKSEARFARNLRKSIEKVQAPAFANFKPYEAGAVVEFEDRVIKITGLNGRLYSYENVSGLTMFGRPVVPGSVGTVNVQHLHPELVV
jgi:hypothetical protein